jgi:hypothetical protein
MKVVRKGLENIRTLKSMANNSMPMTSRGALMERARLTQERERLWDEMDRLNRRIGVVTNRLAEIGQLERSLERFAEARQSSAVSKGSAGDKTKAKRGNREMILKY